MPSSATPQDRTRDDARSESILVIGDDFVSPSAAKHLAGAGEILFVGMGDVGADSAADHAHTALDIDRIADLIGDEHDLRPGAAIIATSRDSQNLLIVVHLQREFDIEAIAVRLNDPQYRDAYADLSVEILDVSDLVGAALAETLERTLESD